MGFRTGKSQTLRAGYWTPERVRGKCFSNYCDRQGSTYRASCKTPSREAGIALVRNQPGIGSLTASQEELNEDVLNVRAGGVLGEQRFHSLRMTLEILRSAEGNENRQDVFGFESDHGAFGIACRAAVRAEFIGE